MKRPWCWEILKVVGEGDDRGRDCWVASLTQWTWVWVGSRSWWWTGKPGMLQPMRSQRVRHDWVTEINIIEWFTSSNNFLMNSSWFIVNNNMTSTNRGDFIFFSSDSDTFFYFSFLISLVRTSSSMLNEVARVGTLVLFLILRKET